MESEVITALRAIGKGLLFEPQMALEDITLVLDALASIGVIDEIMTDGGAGRAWALSVKPHEHIWSRPKVMEEGGRQPDLGDAVLIQYRCRVPGCRARNAVWVETA